MSDLRGRLALEIRAALGQHNDDNRPVVELVGALAAERGRLRDALERTLLNFERLLSYKPVRDATGTIAEARAALAGATANETAINQCDGCRRGLPLVNGIHRGKGYDMIGCTANRYVPESESAANGTGGRS